MKYIIKLSILFSLSIILYSCGGKGNTEPENQVKHTLVKTVDIAPQYFEEKYNVVSIVKPFTSAKISSTEGGLITFLSVEKGSRVGRGQVIARFKKDTDYASYDQSKAQFELALVNFKRIENLYNDQIATEQQYTDAKLQLDIAEKTMEVYESRLSNSYITSPISGIVDEKFMNRGEMSSPGAPIVNIVDISRVKVSAGIPEMYMGTISKGQTVKITFDVFPDEEFEGVINFVSPVLNPLNRTFEVEVVIPNPKQRLKPEMSANMTFTLMKIPDAVVLQQDMIVDNGEEKFVFVLEGDVARKRLLEIGGTNGNFAYIRSGLNPGDKLINVGFQYLSDGDKVQVVN
ncbi:MAG: efflux RND transporter periplasmic adaptor subunit [Ignavibacteria bacterium]|nr:efflux RND transporter periplasmic adaptor subunit [Ignavibacteria bacterium]